MSPVASHIEKIKTSFFNNPVLSKEMRIGLREKKVFIIQTIYMLILGVVAFIFLLQISSQDDYQNAYQLGQSYFRSLIIFQWILIVLISPSLTCTSISSEREKKTYEMLMTTLMSPAEIILGKLVYAGSYIFLLVASSLPLVSLVFFMGGVSPQEIILNYIALLIWGGLISSVALFFSSREKRSSTATSHSYGIIVLLGIPLAFTYLFYFAKTGLLIGYSFKFPEALVWLTVYFNIVWFFLFLFYKIANNLRPQARYIMSLHRLFIPGFLINMLGALALMAAASSSTMGTTPFSLDDQSYAAVWIIFTLMAVFFMGCFIEKRRFISKKETELIGKSLSYKNFFFPLYFIGVGALLLGLFLALGVDPGPTVKSFLYFLILLFSLVNISGDLYVLFKEKVRRVMIYFPLFIAVNIIPFFTWLISTVVSGGGKKACSFFSLVFIHPIFSLLSIWKPTDEFSQVILVPGFSVPAYVLSIIFYVCLAAGIKTLRKLVQMVRGKGNDKGKTAEDAKGAA